MENRREKKRTRIEEGEEDVEERGQEGEEERRWKMERREGEERQQELKVEDLRAVGRRGG